MVEIINDLDSLRQPAEPLEFISESGIQDAEGKEIIEKLHAVMAENTSLLTLAAPQIGINKRIFCIRFGKSDYRTFVNPIVENLSNPCLVPEACYSIPDKKFLMPRFSKVTLWSMTPLGKPESRTFVGMAATTVEHCMHHLDGGLISDVGLELDDLWYSATDEEREEVSKLYLESLDLRNKQMQDEINADKDLKQINDASQFIESVRTGETVVEPLVGEETKDEVNT
jgi:peptide deformylase